MSKRNLKEERIGQTFTSNQGHVFKIVDYINSNEVLIEFQDEHKHQYIVTYRQCKLGKVNNPFHRTVRGVGYVGVGKYKPGIGNGKVCREYKVWERMFDRCYNENIRYKHQSYLEATVCERWHCFQNFMEDITKIEGYELWRENDGNRIALDKDIKGNGTKVYSLETCCFVTQTENSLERIARVPMPTIAVVGRNVYNGNVIECGSLQELPYYIQRTSISKGLKEKGWGFSKNYIFMKRDEFDMELFNELRYMYDNRVVVLNINTRETSVFENPHEVVKSKIISRDAIDRTLKRNNLKIINGHQFVYLKNIPNIHSEIDSTVEFRKVYNEEFEMSKTL